MLSGETLFHDQIKLSTKQKDIQREKLIAKKKLKEQRRNTQNENVQRKLKEKEQRKSILKKEE
jgi:hypothetical protein